MTSHQFLRTSNRGEVGEIGFCDLYGLINLACSRKAWSIGHFAVGPRGIEPRTFGLKALQDGSDGHEEPPENGPW